MYRSWIKMSETLGKENVKNGPNLSSSLAQVLMGDTSLSEAKYNYFRIFTLFYYICIHVPLSFHIYTQMEIQKYKSVMTLTVIYFEKVALYKFNSSASTFIQIYHDLSWLVIPNLNHHLIHREKCSFMFNFTWQWLLVSFPDSFEWSLKARYGKREVLFCMWLDPTAILEKIDVNSLLNHNVSIWC